jgi:integrase
MMKLSEFISLLSERAFSAGHYRKYDIYRSISYRIRLYTGNDDPLLDTVFTLDFLNGFRNSLLSSNLSRNTVSFYVNVMRSIYTAAVNSGRLEVDPNLITSFRTKNVPTEKRAISADSIAKLHASDLSLFPDLEQCRDLFMLSFYFQGIPFVDLLHLRKGDLKGNLLTYFRQKTGTLVSVHVLDEAREYLSRLLDSHEANTSCLLPLLTCEGEDGYKQYQTALRRYNRKLKVLAKHLGIEETLTSYVARHTWATMAHHSGVDVAIVSQAMGHRTEEMTHTYLSSFGQEQLREANVTVLNAVLRPIKEGNIQDVREEVREQCASNSKAEYRTNRKAPVEEKKEYTNYVDRRRMGSGNG